MLRPQNGDLALRGVVSSDLSTVDLFTGSLLAVAAALACSAWSAGGADLLVDRDDSDIVLEGR